MAHGAGLRAHRLGKVVRVPRHVSPLHPQDVDRQLLSHARFHELQFGGLAVLGERIYTHNAENNVLPMVARNLFLLLLNYSA